MMNLCKEMVRVQNVSFSPVERREQIQGSLPFILDDISCLGHDRVLRVITRSAAWI